MAYKMMKYGEAINATPTNANAINYTETETVADAITSLNDTTTWKSLGQITSVNGGVTIPTSATEIRLVLLSSSALYATMDILTDLLPLKQYIDLQGSYFNPNNNITYSMNATFGYYSSNVLSLLATYTKSETFEKVLVYYR